MRGIHVVLLGIIVAAIGSIIAWYGNSVLIPREKATSGILEAPEVDFSKPFNIIYGGGSRFTIYYDETEGEIDLKKWVDLGIDFPVRIHIVDGKLYVSTEVFDKNGDKIGTITHNNWATSESKVLAYDRNYNSFAFEVLDSALIPRIQVILRPNNVIYIGGLYISPEGAILITPQEFSGFSPPDIMEYTDEEIRSKLTNIFLYPSIEHLGELNPDFYNYKTKKFWFEK